MSDTKVDTKVSGLTTNDKGQLVNEDGVRVSANGKPLGRPKGAKSRPKKAVGRPKGEAGIMKEYRERMLNSPRSAKVLDSIFNAALDDDHKNQAAAWKIIVDRIVPVSGFEKEVGNNRAAIQVNISGVPGVNISSTPSGPSEEETGHTLEGEIVDES